MKKILVIVAFLIIVAINFNSSDIIIPNEAIRFRIIANSNSIEDQLIKNNLEKELESYLFELTKSSKDAIGVKESLIKEIDNINSFVDNYLSTNNISEHYEISIGNNFFPTKKYKGITYESGYYDSIVVTLGHGQGLNWWCVIYPPLCLIDEDEYTDVEYTSLVEELLNNYNL